LDSVVISLYLQHAADIRLRPRVSERIKRVRKEGKKK